MSNVTHDEGDRIACPHGCGGYTRDLWDFGWIGEEDETMHIDCGKCEKPVSLVRNVSVSYVAKAVEAGQ